VTMRMNSDVWLTFGRLLFATNRVAVRRWLEGKGPLPQSSAFRYWCCNCRREFESVITPTKCLAGCRCEASELSDAVILTHKTHSAPTFPFAMAQAAEEGGDP